MINKIEKIGLDKVCISDIIVQNINDINVLRLLPQVNIIENPESQMFGIQFLKIKDNKKFGTFVAGMKKDKIGKKHYYSRIEFSPSHIRKNNLINMSIKECQSALINIQSYLYETYGISINISNVTFSKLEINCNILLDYQYKEYSQLLEVVCYTISNNEYNPYLIEYKKNNKNERTLDLETIIRENQSMQLVIYDKLAQLKNKGINIEMHQKEIMRIELRLLKPKRIKDAFHSNDLYRIKQERIEEYFMKYFKKYFVDNILKYKQDSEKIIRKMIVKNKEKGGEWIRDTLRQCSYIVIQKGQMPLVIDINDYISIINDYENNGHKARNKKNILEYNQQYTFISETNNIRLSEIQQKVYNMYSQK